ncbi:HAD family hydrolase [Tessaracoccus lacteus]|uniref:HAD hydrolase family protein n=1 Tax=Tessaracoccus lacteus TaxID=3041766 RepID=A0ABY8Q146_9ACTN|nr:HAD hydrolase family protein [Tessaracoccus sp. T21]WGT48454.1 HAD hydrolase family protein [Tessaracoccus sp. T21]
MASDFARNLAYRGPFEREGVGKATFVGFGDTSMSQVRAAFEGQLDIIAGTVPLFGDLSGELCQPGVNKATAIEAVIGHLGIDHAATIGIGDGSNDLEMLDYCAVGIAMGNASSAAKSAADETTSAILDDGIWHAFRSQGLI